MEPEAGSEGDGPGELRFPLGFVVSPDGGIAVLDMGHQAFVVYDADGGFVGNARNEFQSGLLGGDIYYHPRGGAIGPGGLVAYIERDEFDVPTILVKRLPGG